MDPGTERCTKHNMHRCLKVNNLYSDQRNGAQCSNAVTQSLKVSFLTLVCFFLKTTGPRNVTTTKHILIPGLPSIDLARRRMAAVAEFPIKVFALGNTTRFSQVLISVFYTWKSRAWVPSARLNLRAPQPASFLSHSDRIVWQACRKKLWGFFGNSL